MVHTVLFALRLGFWGFIHVAAFVSSLFLYIVEKYSTIRMCYSFSVYLFIDLACFQYFQRRPACFKHPLAALRRIKCLRQSRERGAFEVITARV